MTREEAIECLKTIKRWTPDWDDRKDGLSYWDAIDMALSALRPVSREMVERMFPGCAGCDSVSSKWEIKFCPFCGKPRTDEAMEMVMLRLEALHGE